MLGEVLARVAGARPSSRYRCRPRTRGLKKIKTFYYICVGIGVLGFALVAVPVQIGLLLDDSYGYGAYTRGWMLSLTAIASLIAIPAAGFIYDRQFRRNPELVVRLAGMFVIAYGILLFIAMRMHAIALLLAVRRARRCVHERRVRERRPDRGCGRALSHAHAGVRARARVHLPGRRVLRRDPRGSAVRRARRAHRPDDRGPHRRHHRRQPLHIRRAVPQARHLDGGGGADRGEVGDRADERPSRRDPRAPGTQSGLQLRDGAGPVRRRVRGPARRGARAAGHQRRRQVDAAARDQRARYSRSRRRAAQRPHAHLRRRRAPVPRGDRAAARRRGHVRAS